MAQKKKQSTNTCCEWSVFIARLALVAPFILSVFGKITGFTGQAQWVGQTYPVPELLLVIGIILEVVGIISLVLGYKVKWGAYTLMLFTGLATLMFHIGEPQAFLKNIALIGGLIALVNLSSSGKLALDNKK